MREKEFARPWVRGGAYPRRIHHKNTSQSPRSGPAPALGIVISLFAFLFCSTHLVRRRPRRAASVRIKIVSIIVGAYPRIRRKMSSPMYRLRYIRYKILRNV